MLICRIMQVAEKSNKNDNQNLRSALHTRPYLLNLQHHWKSNHLTRCLHSKLRPMSGYPGRVLQW